MMEVPKEYFGCHPLGFSAILLSDFNVAPLNFLSQMF
jgi:hypothetical protein